MRFGDGDERDVIRGRGRSGWAASAMRFCTAARRSANEFISKTCDPLTRNKMLLYFSRPGMYIETFKVFSDLAETASFSKAATLNSITQSAVSQQIRALEKHFNVTLVERGGRNFSLTAGGHRLSRGEPGDSRCLQSSGRPPARAAQRHRRRSAYRIDLQHRPARIAAAAQNLSATPSRCRGPRAIPALDRGV